MKKINLGIPDIEDLTKKGFKCLDLHMHSTFSDGTNTPEEIVAIAKKKNLIISITDHNEIKGVKKAIELDNKRVIPGIELTSRNAKDILVYFYNLKDLEDFYEKYIKHKKIHPRRGFDLKCLKLSMKDILNALKKYKCLKVIPHPFALKPKTNYRYFKKRQKILEQMDAIEVLQSMQTRKKTLKSIGWAEVSHKPMFGGSDAHTSDIIGSVITAVKSKSLNEILSQIKKNKTFIFGSELTIYNKLKIYLKIILSNISLK
ncbi:MAG TPA: PHP domain-containing protein [Candidatus Nanoarchaeia archaeon]|nr:PHP domain-containing protein [Candidatus Nanoarchaeia archaeon]